MMKKFNATFLLGVWFFVIGIIISFFFDKDPSELYYAGAVMFGISAIVRYYEFKVNK
jgi:hypothetical protein